MTRGWRTLNPLRVDGSALPAELLVAARALVVLVLVQGIEPFPLVLPHFAALGEAFSPVAFRFLTHTLATCGYLFVLVGPFPRAGALLAGVAHLDGLVACRPCLSIAHTYLACLFLALAACDRAVGGRPVRLQMVVLYAGSTLNKAIDPSWWNGDYMHTLLGVRHRVPLYLWLDGELAAHLVARTLGVGTLVVEALLVVFFLRRRWYAFGILLALVFHFSTVFSMSTTFGAFLGALVLSWLAFVPWPQRLRILGARPGAARRLVDLAVRTDPDGRLEASTEMPRRDAGGTTRTCRLAPWRAVVLFHPASYLVAAVLLADPWLSTAWRAASALLLGAVLVPPLVAAVRRGGLPHDPRPISVAA